MPAIVLRGNRVSGGIQSGCRTRHPVEVALCRSALAAGGRIGLHVRGTSMLPALWPGEMVWVERKNVDKLRNGDVIVFVRDHQLVVHRVVDVTVNREGSTLVTRGDAQPQDDVPVRLPDVLGAVRAVRRLGIDRPVSGRPSLAASTLSRLVQRSGMARFLLVGIHSRWMKGRLDLRRLRTASTISR